MPEYINHTIETLQSSGETRADLHMASDHVQSYEQGRQIAQERVEVERALTKEVKLTEKDVVLGFGKRVLAMRQYEAAAQQGLTQNDVELAGGE